MTTPPDTFEASENPERKENGALDEDTEEKRKCKGRNIRLHEGRRRMKAWK